MNSKKFHISFYPYDPGIRPRVVVYDYRRHIHPKPRVYTPTRASLGRIETLTYQPQIWTRAHLTVDGGYDIFVDGTKKRRRM